MKNVIGKYRLSYCQTVYKKNERKSIMSVATDGSASNNNHKIILKYFQLKQTDCISICWL